MKVLVLIALSLVVFSAEGAQMYQWKDSEGNVHFSDKPPPKKPGVEVEKKQVELRNIDSSYESVVDASKVHEDRRSAETPKSRSNKAAKPDGYECSRVARRLKLISGPVEYFDDEGREVIVTERERMAEEKQLTEWIRKNC